jgi:hypothetical protein
MAALSAQSFASRIAAVAHFVLQQKVTAVSNGFVIGGMRNAATAN